MIATGWVAAGVLVWAAVFGTGLALIVRRLKRTSRRTAALPSPLGVLEWQWATGRMSRERFVTAAAVLRGYGIDR